MVSVINYDVFQVLTNTLTNNLGIGLQEIILIILILAAFLFFATNFKIGLIVLLTFTGISFITFVSIGYDATISLYAFLITIVLMALSIYTSRNQKYVGVV